MICKKCNQDLHNSQFLLRKDTGKARNICRTCRSAQNKEWKNQNKQNVQKKSLEWQRKNRAKCRASSLSWSKKNKSKICINTISYKTRKTKAQPSWLSAIEIAQISEMYDIALAKTTQTGIIYHVDHIFPLRGKACCGLHVPWNLQVITAFENLSKGNRVQVPQTGPLT